MSKHIPERMCVGCRKMYPKPQLIKVVSKDNEVKIDRDFREEGRGAYFCRSLECIESAKKKRALSRHFKRQVPESLYDEAKELLNG